MRKKGHNFVQIESNPQIRGHYSCYYYSCCDVAVAFFGKIMLIRTGKVFIAK